MSEHAIPPWWVRQSPCPPWCAGGHRAEDPPVLREHTNKDLGVVLSLVGWGNWGTMERPEYQPIEVTPELWWNTREASPRVLLTTNDSRVELEMTLDEVEVLGAQLRELVRAARSNTRVAGDELDLPQS